MVIGSLLTEFGNNVFVISAMFGMWYAFNWRRAGLTNGSATLIRAWVCIVVAIAFRIGWWIFGLKLAPEGAIYHPFFTEWMWVTTLPAAGLFTWGVLLFIDAIDKMKPKDKFINFAACMVIAALLAAI
jgi:hypothetical protein